MQDDVATINGLALGKKGDTNIDWDEMNAAAGHLALLFAYVFRKYKYTTQKYKINIFIELNQLIVMDLIVE